MGMAVVLTNLIACVVPVRDDRGHHPHPLRQTAAADQRCWTFGATPHPPRVSPWGEGEEEQVVWSVNSPVVLAAVQAARG